MPKITCRDPSGHICLTDSATLSAALEKLAAFEELTLELAAQQQQLGCELETLRQTQGVRSAQFREAMGRKLRNSWLLSLLQARGLLE